MKTVFSTLIAVSACDSTFFEEPDISGVECPAYVADVRSAGNIALRNCRPAVTTEHRPGQGCVVEVSVDCSAGRVELAALVGAETHELIDGPCRVDGEVIRCEAYDVTLLERAPLPYRVTRLLSRAAYEPVLPVDEPEKLEDFLAGSLRRGGYFRDLMLFGDEVVTVRYKEPNNLGPCPSNQRTELGLASTTSTAGGPRCLQAVARLDADSFLGVFGSTDLRIGTFRRRQLDGVDFDLVDETVFSSELSCGRVPSPPPGSRLDSDATAISVSEPRRQAVISVIEAPWSLSQSDRPVDVLGSYVLVVDLEPLSVRSCRFFGEIGGKRPQVRDVEWIDDQILMVDDSRNALLWLTDDLGTVTGTVSLDTVFDSSTPEVVASPKLERSFAVDLRGWILLVQGSSPRSGMPQLAGTASPILDAGALLPTTMTPVGEDLFAVGLYEWQVEEGTPVVGNAYLGFFDPKRGGFLPGAIELGVFEPRAPSGVVGRIVASEDGEHLYALLTWAGAVVELSRVTSGAR